jgi:Diguanylate cyclase, GGDEF domain
VALLPGTALETAVAAERVRAALAAADVVRRGCRVAATVSVGVASGSPTTAIDALITRADDALYRAKENGRNRVEIAADPDNAMAAGSDQTAAGEKKRAPRTTAPNKVASPSNAGRDFYSHTRTDTMRASPLGRRYAE